LSLCIERLGRNVSAVRPRDGASLAVHGRAREVIASRSGLEDTSPFARREVDLADGSAIIRLRFVEHQAPELARVARALFGGTHPRLSKKTGVERSAA
jgi:hypothetical protein